MSHLTTGRDRVSPLEDDQERRSFEFFRAETMPGVAGYFGSPTWKLVLQAAEQEPAVSKAIMALGALHEKLTIQASNSDGGRMLETTFPLRQYSKALGELRKYLSAGDTPNINVVLICALIHISIEAMQKHYSNALVHLENSFQLLQASTQGHKPEFLGAKNTVESEISSTFFYFDVHLSGFQGRRNPVLLDTDMKQPLPGRFSSLTQAKNILDYITSELLFFIRGTAEEYRFRRSQDIPADAIAEVTLIRDKFEGWKDRFEKFLHRSTSRFSRDENSIIDLLIINHRIGWIEASTCTAANQTIFDQFDSEFNEIVTLAENFCLQRSMQKVVFTLDLGVIMPLFVTSVKCREPWIRQRATRLLGSIKFQEGAWDAAMHARVARVAIEREYASDAMGGTGARPAEFARVHSVGADELDQVKRVAQVTLTQKLSGMDGPWHRHIEWCSW